MSGATPARRLRQLLRGGCIALPGAFNAYVARLAERAGFPACYVSGAGLANATAGVPDIGRLSRREVSLLASYICRAVRIPVIADADTGFDGVAATVRGFEAAGLAGLHLEDQVFPKRCGHLGGKEVVPIREMAAKLRSAVRARRDSDFLIIARTDARSVEGLDAAIERARRYVAAGADAIFPEALESAAEFRAFAAAIHVPLVANMTEFGKSPLLGVKELARMGYRMVVFPQTAFRTSMRTAERCLIDLKRRGSQRAWLGRMQTRAQLYHVLGYDPNRDRWP